MVETSHCPSIEELRDFVGGRTPEPSPGLEPHLLECLDCARLTVQLSNEDTVLSAFLGMRRPPEFAAGDSALLNQMMSRFVSLRNQESGTASTMETSINPGHDSSGAPEDLSHQLGRGWRPAESDNELGRFGDYRILKTLGSGGMGAVFLAEETQLRRLVALKVMRPGVAAEPEAANRFLLEARSAAALRSDHIVTIYQVGRVEDVPFVAMERLEGESLEQRLCRPSRLSTDEILRIGREIANGLAAAHARGLIHRDIKPANVWLERVRGRVKLLDFGLVRSTESDSRLTTSGAILGTPAYMSPEQACGEDVDHRTDLFSLGVTLYRMTTG